MRWTFQVMCSAKSCAGHSVSLSTDRAIPNDVLDLGARRASQQATAASTASAMQSQSRGLGAGLFIFGAAHSLLGHRLFGWLGTLKPKKARPI